MRVNKIWAAYFSPTGTTSKITERIAMQVAAGIDRPVLPFDFTLPASRQGVQQYQATDLVVFGTPVYAGRVPNVLLTYLNSLEGNGALAVPVVLFGNRNYDDALKELYRILADRHFCPMAAAAFVGEHSFSLVLAKDRPDDADLAMADSFADNIAGKLIKGDYTLPSFQADSEPLKKYYQPRTSEGTPIDIRKVLPKTNENCTHCDICADHCPMGAIDNEDLEHFLNICIKCGACIKKCPFQARYFDDENYLFHKLDLEETYVRRAEPSLFI